MRACEFITEQNNKNGKIPKRYQQASRGLRTFIDDNYKDRVYELNRVMMAAAMADGSLNPININPESWAGRNNIAIPYTKEEDNMMRVALAAVGSQNKDLNHGDLRSLELDSVNKKSPIPALKSMSLGKSKKSKK